MVVEILSFIFVLGLLIFIHELGHFLLAKLVGIRVEQFSLGFPPKMMGFTRGETEYRIGWIPLGGYVKMTGEQPSEEENSGASYEFMSKKIWQRALVILAGPVMNYVLAFAILAGVFFFQGQAVVDDTRATVGEVLEKSPAEKAGLQPKDVIIAVNDSEVTDYRSLFDLIKERPGESIRLTWLRADDTMSSVVTTWADTTMDMDGKVVAVGKIGTYQDFEYQDVGFLGALDLAFARTNEWGLVIIKFLKDVISQNVSSRLIGGPLFIAQAVGQAAQEGFVSVLLLAAILSVNLCVINLIPIPVLDGGQLLFLVIEKFKGSPVSLRTRAIMQQAGFLVLMGLIIFVTHNDIWRILQFGW